MSGSSTDLRRLTRSGGATAPAPSIGVPPRRWKTRVLLPGAIVVVVAVLLLVTSARTLLPATDVRVEPVIVKTVEGSVGSVTVQAPGWLEPDPHPQYVTALADGVVEEILVLEGDPVEAGTVVARLVDDDARLALRRADAELLQRRAALRSASAELTAAQVDLENLVERSRSVAAGEAIATEARAEILQARASSAVERARLAEIQDEYDRKSKLTESSAVSEAVVARLRLRLDAQRAAVEAASAREGVLEARLARAEADLQAAHTKRTLLVDERRAVAMAESLVGGAEAAVELAEAARDEAALRLDRMLVRSPVGGIVMRRLASPGSKLMRDGPEHSLHVLHVYDPRHLQVRVDVPLADAALVTVGQAAEVTVEVLADRIFTGRVTRVVHQADIQKNTVEMKVALDDPSVELTPDMLARVRFMAAEPASDGSVRQRVFAPASLIRMDGDRGSTAWIVTGLLDGRGRAEPRAVVTGARRIDGWIEVAEGLSAGDLVIADPPSDLEAGDRVRVVGASNESGGN